MSTLSIPSAVNVSIQLESPASGDDDVLEEWADIFKFPFNWDPQRVGTNCKDGAFYSTDGFPFNWDPQRVGINDVLTEARLNQGVSIQLGSPASGDRLLRTSIGDMYQKFPFNWDPQRVGTCPIKTHTGRAFQAPFARDSYFPPI